MWYRISSVSYCDYDDDYEYSNIIYILINIFASPICDIWNLLLETAVKTLTAKGFRRPLDPIDVVTFCKVLSLAYDFDFHLGCK